jgi:hypothetical protein
MEGGKEANVYIAGTGPHYTLLSRREKLLLISPLMNERYCGDGW